MVRPRLSDAQATKFVEKVNRWFKESEQAREPYAKLGAAAYRATRSHIPEDWPFPTKVWDPYFWSNRRAHIAARKKAIFSTPCPMEAVPEGESDREQAADMSTLLRYHWRKNEPRRKVTNLLEDGETWGTSYAYWGWAVEHRKQMTLRREPQFETVFVPGPTGFPMQAEVPVGEVVTQKRAEVRTKFHACFEPIPFLEAYPDPTRQDVQEGRFFIRRSAWTKEELERRAKDRGWNRRHLLKELFNRRQEGSGGLPAEVKRTQELLQEIGFGGEVGDASGKGEPQFDVMEVWTREYVAVIVDRTAEGLVHYDFNPFIHGLIPITVHRNWVLPGEFWGISPWEIIRFAVMGLQTWRNAAATEAMLRAFVPLLVKMGSPALNDIRAKGFGPKAIFRVRQTDEVAALQLPTSGVQLSDKMAQDMRQVADDAMGTHETMRGGSPQGDSTATEAQIAQAGSGGRMEDIMGDWDTDFTVGGGRQCISNIQQFEEAERVVSVTEDQESPMRIIYVDPLRTQEFDLQADSVNNVQKALNQKRWLEIIELAGRMMPPNFNVGKAFERAVGDIAGPKAVQEVIYSPEEQAAQQQAQQAAMAQQAGGVVSQPGAGMAEPGQEMGADLAAAVAM